MKKNLLKTFLLSLFALTLVGCESNIHDPESNVSEHGIQVKALGAGTDGDGHEYKTYAYVVVPSNSTTPIAASVSFADSRADGSSYLTATVDNAVKEFTITCIAPFDSQATVRIYATIGSAYADVTVDYRQRLTTASFASGFTVGDEDTTSLFWSDFSTGHYTLTGSSVYTLSNTFSYTGLKSFTVATQAGVKCNVNSITQDLDHASAVLDIETEIGNAINSWMNFSIKGAQGDQSDKDLIAHVEGVLSTLSAYEKQVLGTADNDGLIKITFLCSALEHYYSSSVANDLSYSTPNTTMSFNIPADIYESYGVFKSVQSITPTIDSVEF